MRQALADSSGARKEKTLATFLLLGFKLVVGYCSLANTHPARVRRVVLKTPPNEEYGVHPRICSYHLTCSGNSLPVRVSTAHVNLVAVAWDHFLSVLAASNTATTPPSNVITMNRWLPIPDPIIETGLSRQHSFMSACADYLRARNSCHDLNTPF